MKKYIFLLSLLCVATVCNASKKDKTKGKTEVETAATIRNYPSGAVDEYHFRRGEITVMGSLKDVSPEEFRTINLTGYDYFTNESFSETIKMDSEGNFMKTFMVPHSQYFYLEYFDYYAFAAVGDTLIMNISGSEHSDNGAVFDGTGVTGEVNRLWPSLERQVFADQPDEEPWLEKKREVMLDWRKRKLEKFRAVVRALNDDGISGMEGCSDFAKDVLKSNLLARIPQEIGIGFHQYGWRIKDEQFRTPPELAIKNIEVWDFLSQCEQFILDNPLMLLSRYASDLTNKIEYAPFDSYIFLANGIDRWTRGNEPENVENYQENFILPATYNPEEHKQLLAYRNGSLLSVADYYQMASDTIKSRYHLSKTNFMMQICLMHYALDIEDSADELYPNTIAERMAGAIPQFDNKIVAHHAVDKYRKFVVEKEGFRPEESSSPEGDAVFSALLEKYKGNVIYMDFWGISCGPCRAEMKEQRENVEYFKDKPVRYLYICNEKDSPREPSEDFMNTNNIQGEHIFLSIDDWNFLSQKFQFNATPFRLLIDRNGNIVSKNVVPSRKQIEALLL